MNAELIRQIDVLSREKDIDKEILFESLESALTSAARKKLGVGEELIITINRKTGALEYNSDEFEINPMELGRIAAQTAKQVMIQKIREAERDVVYGEFDDKIGRIVTGTVHRFEGEAIIVSLSKVEGIIPREERVKGETYHMGERIRCIVTEVRKVGQKVRIILSRAHPDFVRRLFELEVPEIADKIIEVKRVVREPGYRTKLAVFSGDPKIDCVGACVGVRGSRIKSIIDELNGEKIDIIKWSDSLEILIMNALKPAQIVVENIFPNEATHSATVVVDEEQQSLAIGKKGQNVRLASKLCGWEIDIKTRAELEAEELAKQGGGSSGVSAPAPAEEAATETTEQEPASEENVSPTGQENSEAS